MAVPLTLCILTLLQLRQPERATDALPARLLLSEPHPGANRQGAPASPQKVEPLVLNVTAHVRYVLPFGAADRSTVVYGPGLVVVEGGVSWTDFFNPGWGLDLEVDLFLGNRGPGPNRDPGFNYGIAVLLMTDEFGGEHLSGAAGSSIDLDDLTMNSFLVGGKVLQTLGSGFYADGEFALGVVHYTSVDGKFSGPGFVTFRDEVFEDTWTFASMFRGHAGYRLGPVGIVLGLGLRILAPPSEGGRFSMDSGAFWTFDIDLGVELGF